MGRHDKILKEKVRKLWAKGLTYTEINSHIKIEIPKATLAYWVRDIILPEEYKAKHRAAMLSHLVAARILSVKAKRKRIQEYCDELERKHSDLYNLLSDARIKRMVLGILYLSEGSKTLRGAVTFGNSDPKIISLFLRLFRNSYSLDESKFRCTLQLRADQNIKFLENYWSKITSIPRSQFYKSRVDSRSVGKVTLKKEYKGVCKIDYFSANLLYELMSIGKILVQ